MSNESRIAIMEIKIQSLEENQRDHEKRLRHSEKYIYIAMGGLGLLQLILKFWPFN